MDLVQVGAWGPFSSVYIESGTLSTRRIASVIMLSSKVASSKAANIATQKFIIFLYKLAGN
jgi:hypothetical protein